MTDKAITLEDEFYRLAGGAQVLGDPNGEPAYLYTRSSSKLQAVEGSESLSRQLLVAHEKAKNDGRYIPLEMAYWDVWRGKDADRPEFLRLLSDLKTDTRSEVIYVDQTDRLSRSTAVYYVLLHDLIRFGITVRFATEEDELIRHIKLAFDEIELDKRRYRQIQANRARATKGHVISKYAPFGYSMSADNLSYLINEEKAPWIRQIFDWYVSGKSIKWIAKTMSNSGVPSPLGKRVWSPETIRGVLHKEVYKGVYIANRYERIWVWEEGKQKKIERIKPEHEWIYVPVPALVGEQQWEMAQHLLETNKKNSQRNAVKREWLLSGLARCACGCAIITKYKTNSYTLTSGERKDYRLTVYACWHNLQRWDPTHCDRGWISKPKLEKYVVAALEMLFLKPDLWEQHTDDQSDLMERSRSHVTLCERQLKEIDAQVEELLQLVLEQRSSRVRELFNQKQKELEGQRKGYEEQLRISQDRLKAAQETENQRETIEEVLREVQELGGIAGLPYDVKRIVLTRLVDEITVDTKEHWFEIKGVLGSSLERFSYTVDGKVVSTSVDRPCQGHAMWQ